MNCITIINKMKKYIKRTLFIIILIVCSINIYANNIPLSFYETTKYNKNQHKINKIRYNEKNQIIFQSLYQYNRKGLLAREERYYYSLKPKADSKLPNILSATFILYTYNEKNSIEREIDNLGYKIYYYDKRRNITRIENYRYFSPINISPLELLGHKKYLQLTNLPKAYLNSYTAFFYDRTNNAKKKEEILST